MKKASYRKQIKKSAAIRLVLNVQAQRTEMGGNIFSPNRLKIMSAEYVGGNEFELYIHHGSEKYRFTRLIAPVQQLKAHMQHVQGWPNPTTNNNILKFYYTNGIIKIKDTDNQEYALAEKNLMALAPNIGDEQPSRQKLKQYEYGLTDPTLGKVNTELSPNAVKETENVRATNPQTSQAPQLRPSGASARMRKRASRLKNITKK